MKRAYAKFSILIAFLFLSQSSFATFIDRVKLFQSQVDYQVLGIPQSEVEWEEIFKKSLRRIGKGGEGYVFVSHPLAHDCYKKFHQEGGVQFGVASLIYARQEVSKYSELRRWITVPRVYSFGKGWIHREYFPGGMKVEAALENSEEAREAYREIHEFLKRKRAFYGEEEEDSASIGAESLSLLSEEEGVRSGLREGLILKRTLSQSQSLFREFSASSGAQIDPFEGSVLGEGDVAAPLSDRQEGSSSPGLKELEGKEFIADSGLRPKAFSLSDGRRDRRGSVRGDTPVPAMLNEEGAFEYFSDSLSLEVGSVFREGRLPVDSEIKGGVGASLGSEEERDFVMGLSQRVDGKTNNLLWMPQIHQFVWIDIF